MRWGREKPETERYRNERRWMRLGATAALPLGFTVGVSGTLRWTEYEGSCFPFTEDGSPRSDITRHLRVFAHNRAFTVGGFSPQVSLVREDRTSTASCTTTSGPLGSCLRKTVPTINARPPPDLHERGPRIADAEP